MNILTSCYQSKITKTYLLISFLLMTITSIAMLGIYYPYFLSITNNTPYLETKFLYSPSDLYEMATKYGKKGRRLYIIYALSLDMLIPITASNLFASTAIFLRQKLYIDDNKNMILIGICSCLSDIVENLLMVVILEFYPEKCFILSLIAAIFTNVKYISGFYLIGVIFFSLVKIVNKEYIVKKNN